MNKSAYQIISETNKNEIGLALIYIEYERQMINSMKLKDKTETARKEGILEGILTASKLLGVNDFYGNTISKLRFSIQEEKKEAEETSNEIDN